MTETSTSRLDELRGQMGQVNADLLACLNRFFAVAQEIGRQKDLLGLPHFDPVRESAMLIDLQLLNRGPASQDAVKHIFKEIFKASVDAMGHETKKRLQINRTDPETAGIVTVNGIAFGGPEPVIIAGPCAVESMEQIEATAAFLSSLGVRCLRGGAFKPRSSPYSFQGLELEALRMLRQAADRYNMIVVTEVLDTDSVPMVEEYADIVQVGTRNMHNTALLKRLGRCSRPIFLKRGFMSTLDEFIFAAEYVFVGGNPEIILCERGIRTFERQTRNTLDISAVPILKKETILPVVVDISHSTGRKDIVKPMALAALAAGADGIMVESHINPSMALSDAHQQLNPEETADLIRSLPQFSGGRQGQVNP